MTGASAGTKELELQIQDLQMQVSKLQSKLVQLEVEDEDIGVTNGTVENGNASNGFALEDVELVDNTGSLLPDVDMALYPDVSRAQVLLMSGKENDAIALLKKVADVKVYSAQSAAAYFWLGEIHTKRYKLEDAAKYYVSGFQVDQQGLYGGYNLYALAQDMKRLGKHDESCKIFKQFIAKEQEDDSVYSLYLLEMAQQIVNEACK